jgi:hypothetical protein
MLRHPEGHRRRVGAPGPRVCRRQHHRPLLSQEREARSAKAGLWSGDVERPAAYRDKLWAEAKRRAPDGCPIKGQVAGAQRTYVLPWSPDYERARVQKTRGERWFCSEQEALAAGFKAAQRG